MQMQVRIQVQVQVQIRKRNANMQMQMPMGMQVQMEMQVQMQMLRIQMQMQIRALVLTVFSFAVCCGMDGMGLVGCSFILGLPACVRCQGCLEQTRSALERLVRRQLDRDEDLDRLCGTSVFGLEAVAMGSGNEWHLCIWAFGTWHSAFGIWP